MTDASWGILAPDSDATIAISAYLHSAFANCICLGVRHSGCISFGDATTKTAHRAREVATFRRLRL